MVQHFQIKEASTKGFPDNKRNTFGAFSITHFQKSLSNLIKWSFTFLKHNEGGLKWPLFFYDWRRIYEYNTRPTTGIVEANSRI